MTRKEFIALFAEFYEKIFGSSSETTRLLAEIQKRFPEEYESIKAFSSDPQSIDSIINELNEEEQTLLLKTLLKAGTFGRRLAMLFDLTYEEKNKLADDLDSFAKDLKRVKSER